MVSFPGSPTEAYLTHRVLELILLFSSHGGGCARGREEEKMNYFSLSPAQDKPGATLKIPNSFLAPFPSLSAYFCLLGLSPKLLGK